MKRTSLYILLFMSQYLIVSGQGYIQTDAHQMAIIDIQPDGKDVSYLDPVRTDDPLEIRLFKQYFNPGSFNAYRNFFLAEDWGGFAESDFTAWQSYLRKNKVKLDKTMRVQEENNQEFIVCHYTVESEFYIMPSTAIFKKTGQGWKHISFMNDPEAMDLKQIGLLQTEAITSLREGGGTARLANLERKYTIEPVEKFDRAKLFGTIAGVLEEKEVSASDMSLARDLFVERAEIEMVKYIAGSYEIDVYDLMDELNTAMGFKLFKFVRTVKSN